MAVIGLLAALFLCWPPSGAPAEKTPVFVTASILDKNRLYLETLSRSDIRVFENGQQREVEFLASKEVPVAYGLLFDRDLLPSPYDDPRRNQFGVPSSTAATNVAYQLLDQALGHEVGWVASYDTEFHLAMDFTQDAGRIKDAIQLMSRERYIEEPELFSALMEAVGKLSRRNEKRRILIVFVDYLDMKTGGKLKPLKNLLSASNVELFVVGVGNSKITGDHGMPTAQSEASLRELTGVTAGGAYFALLDGIEGMGRRIAYQINTYYTIGFQAESPRDQPGKMKIDCTVAGAKVTAHPVVPILQ
jgi:VWFA-related protein